MASPWAGRRMPRAPRGARRPGATGTPRPRRGRRARRGPGACPPRYGRDRSRGRGMAPRPRRRRRRPWPGSRRRPRRPAGAGRSAAPSNRARSAVSRSPSAAGRATQAFADRGHAAVGSRNSDAGSRVARSSLPVARWSVGSNARSESISSPNSSMRIGSSIEGGKTSMIPPRRANSPRPATSTTGRVAEVEQLAKQGRPGGLECRRPARAARSGRSSGAMRVLEQRLDAGHKDPDAAVAPGGERRDPGGRLVGDELAPLVGEGGPRFEHRDGGGVAQPGAELLGHAVADLGIAGDPDQWLAAGRPGGERRREEGLGTVGHGHEAGVTSHPADVRW